MRMITTIFCLLIIVITGNAQKDVVSDSGLETLDIIRVPIDSIGGIDENLLLSTMDFQSTTDRSHQINYIYTSKRGIWMVKHFLQLVKAKSRRSRDARISYSANYWFELVGLLTKLKHEIRMVHYYLCIEHFVADFSNKTFNFLLTDFQMRAFLQKVSGVSLRGLKAQRISRDFHTKSTKFSLDDLVINRSTITIMQFEGFPKSDSYRI